MRKIVLVIISVAAQSVRSAEEEAACWSAREAAGQSAFVTSHGGGREGAGPGLSDKTVNSKMSR